MPPDQQTSVTLGARILQRIDRLQRRSAILGFSYAVVKKYGEDGGSKQAVLLTYYGFLSAIPLLLIVVWAASGVLRDDPLLRDEFINALVPDQLSDALVSALAAMPTSAIPLIIGIFGLLYTGNGIVVTAYDVLNNLQSVPHRERFGFGQRYLRSFIVLLALLLSLVLLASMGVGVASLGWGLLGVVMGLAGSWVVLTGLLMTSVALLSARAGSWRHAWPAALLGGAVLSIVVLIGGFLLTTLVSRSGAVYGPFAAVVGLFSLLYFVSQGLLFSGEIAVVRQRRLWPRALVTTAPTVADQRSLEYRVRIEQRTETEHVDAAVGTNLADEPETGLPEARR